MLQIYDASALQCNIPVIAADGIFLLLRPRHINYGAVGIFFYSKPYDIRTVNTYIILFLRRFIAFRA